MKNVAIGKLLAGAVAACLVCGPAEARDRAVPQEFQRLHPCPSTGRTSGACPGYVRDHVVPLACGGSDSVGNIQWQTVAEARAKDRWERKGCGK
jgi:hypothetical protein